MSPEDAQLRQSYGGVDMKLGSGHAGAERIRAAEPNDVPALSALAKRTWSDAFGEGVSPADEAAELDEGRSETYFANALKEKTVLVAEEGGAL